MTAVSATPGTGGRRRRRLALVAIAVVFIIIAVFILIFTASAKSGDDNLTCANAEAKWYSAAAELTKVEQDDNLSNNQKREQARELRTERDAAKLKVGECQDGETSSTLVADPGPGGPGECQGVVYRSYMVKSGPAGANTKFGPMPVNVSGTGDVGKVKAALAKELSSDAFKAAVMTQGRYLVDGGISVDQVQATATRFQQNPDQWRDSNRVIRAKLSRASFELVPFNGSYATQDAVLGENRCVAPAAQDTHSSGQRWILVVHLSPQDGGRTVRLVVDCDFQIQELGPAPAPRQPAPHVPTTAPPAVPTTRPYTPPTTAPPTTTTAPPTTTTTRPRTTTTLPNKYCTTNPDDGSGLPLCDGGGSR